MPRTRFIFAFCIGAMTLFCNSTSAADVSGSKDHPLLSRFPGSTIIAYQAHDYDAAYIPTKPTTSRGFAEGSWVYGKFSWIVYRAAANRSTLEIYRNYEAAMTRAGFEPAFSCQKDECGNQFIRRMIGVSGTVGQYESWRPNTGRYLAAKLDDGSGVTWVSLLVHEDDKQLARIRLEIVEVGGPRPVDPFIAMNSNFAGATRIGAKDREYDEARLAADGVRDDKLTKVLNLEGKIAWRAYRMTSNVSPIEVVHAFQNSLEGRGWERAFHCSRGGCGADFIKKVINLNGNSIGSYETWSRNSGYYVLMTREDMGATTHLATLAYSGAGDKTVVRQMAVTSRPLALDLVKVSAESLAKEMDESGRVAIYGIYFDTDRADLRPESESTLEEIARLLVLRPALSIFVDGHTDDRGSDEYNRDLSERRAQAVVTALTQRHNVDARRLKPRGLGETQPVDDNATEAGRAKNRRVELVADSGDGT